MYTLYYYSPRELIVECICIYNWIILLDLYIERREVYKRKLRFSRTGTVYQCDTVSLYRLLLIAEY